MKVIYFTFLVMILFISQSFADCWGSCGCANGSCPNDQAFLCWRSCEKSKTQSSAQTSQSATSKKTSAAKETTSRQGDSSNKETTTQAGSSVKACTKKGYVWSDIFEDCVPEQTKKSLACQNNKGVWNSEKQECLTQASCERGGGDWDPQVMDCVEKKNTTSDTQNSECEKQFADAINKCMQEADSAMTSCNDNNDEMQAAENASKLIGAGSVASMQVACSKIGELSKLANGAFSGWKVACSTNQGGCTESCTEAKRIINECMQEPMRTNFANGYNSIINKNITQCESYKTKIAQATQHAAAALAQLKASEQCKNDTSSLVNNAVDQCKANPSSPLCKDLQKCSDANFAAQNPVCACASNPTSSACLQASANYGSGTSSTGATLPGVNGGKDTSGLPGINSAANGDGQNLNGLGTNAAPATDGHGVGGRQGDASSAGNLKNNAAGGSNAAGNHYAAGTGKDPLKVNSGTLGGVPGGPGYFGRNPSSGGYNGNNAINASSGALGKFDPRKYITGLGGKGEYINGANQNIFMIVKMRYEDKKTSLLPENFNLKK